MDHDSQKLSRVFVTEIGIAADDLRAAFENKLHKKFGLITQKKSGSKNFHDSIAAKTSMFKALVRGEPPHIKWLVEELSQTSSKIYISFVWPFSLKISILLLIGVLGLALHIPTILLNTLSAKAVSEPASNLFVVLQFCIFCFASLSLTLLLIIIMFSQFRYKDFSEKLVEEIYNEIAKKNIVLSADWNSNALVSALSWKLFLAIISTFLLLWLYPKNYVESSWHIIGMVVAPLIIIAGFGLLIIALERKGRLYARRVMILCYNSAIAMSIIAVLLSYVISFGICNSEWNFQKWPNHQITKNMHSHNSNWNNRVEIGHTQTLPETISPYVHKAKIASLLLYPVQALFVFIPICFIGILNNVYKQVFLGTHQNYLKKRYNKKIENDEIDCLDIAAPISVRIISIGAFVLFSLLCWMAVYINVLIIANMIGWFPSVPGALFAGKIFNTVSFFAYSWVGEFGVAWLEHAVQILLLLPAIIPFLVFSYLNIRALVKSHRKFCGMEPLGNELAEQIQEIAEDMGVRKVSCVIDTKSDSISPRTEIRGFVSRKVVILTKNCLVFFDNNPNLIRPIIAHEVAHLKKHWTKIRHLRILSRLSLLGTGFLSVFIDSIKIEKEADNLAADYLQNKTILRQAIQKVDIEFMRIEKSKKSSQVAIAAFWTDSGSSTHPAKDKNTSLLGKIYSSLCFAYVFYFELDVYDYIHIHIDPRLKNLSAK